MIKYSNFLNESKFSELNVGDRIIFGGKISLDVNYYLPFDMKGKTGVIKSKTDKMYDNTLTVTLDVPLILPQGKGKKVNTIKLNTYQLRGVHKSDDTEYQELQKKLASGDVAKFQSTKIFMIILKNIKFKRKGDYFDVSYFDIVKDEPGNVSFVPSKKSIGEDFEKYRQVTRIGRVLKKLNPDLNEKEIEEFVNKYKSEIESYLKEPEIEVVTGEDISKWYHQRNYQKGGGPYGSGGSLNQSCMRYDHEQKSVRFYDMFPDRIAMAIYTKNGKLWARALIWKLDDGRVYMDRIYSVDDPSRIQLEKYAEKNNMLMHKNKRYAHSNKIKVTLKDGKIKLGKDFYTPYFDSFSGSSYMGDKSADDIVLTASY